MANSPAPIMCRSRDGEAGVDGSGVFRNNTDLARNRSFHRRDPPTHSTRSLHELERGPTLFFRVQRCAVRLGRSTTIPSTVFVAWTADGEWDHTSGLPLGGPVRNDRRESEASGKA